jgi:putative ABC transport system substrate-binding protein
MKRRDFAVFLASSVAGWPATSFAQAQRMRQVGVLISFAESDPESQIHVAAFRDRLKQLGWNEGRNITVDVRWGNSDLSRIGILAKQLVERRPDVLVGRSTPTVTALLRETHDIPIVFVVVSDPVGEHFVASLNRPGGTVTGFTNVEASLGSKWLQLLKDLAPRIKRVAVVSDPTTAPGAGTFYLRFIETAASAFGVKVMPVLLHDISEISRAIEAFARAPDGGLVMPPDITTVKNRKLIIDLASKYRLPAMFPFGSIVAEGGLISYGIDYTDIYRRSASYVDRILRGEKPSELPVQAPEKFELSVNLKTARTLGLTVPQFLLLQADKVIE